LDRPQEAGELAGNRHCRNGGISLVRVMRIRHFVELFCLGLLPREWGERQRTESGAYLCLLWCEQPKARHFANRWRGTLKAQLSPTGAALDRSSGHQVAVEELGLSPA
jgi:hypothetical protein